MRSTEWPPGLSNVEALRAAIVSTAESFGLDDRGVIRPGATRCRRGTGRSAERL
jgi:N-acyl-D-aspartate/D-glutamate deacylase